MGVDRGKGEPFADRIVVGKCREWFMKDLRNARGDKTDGEQTTRKCGKQLRPPSACKRNVKIVEDVFEFHTRYKTT